MKTLILATSLIISAPAFASPSVKDFTLDCTATAVVQKTFAFQYSPGLPPQGRFDGVLPSASAKGIVEISKLSPGCAPLETKYKLPLVGFTFPVSFGLPADPNGSAPNLTGQSIELTLEQNFGYQKNGYLPLFPKVHSESMYFHGKGQGFSVGFELKPNINWVYGIKPIEQFSDIEKLSLAETAAHLVAQKNYGDFLNLLVQLEPDSLGLKKSYAELLLKMLREIKAQPYTQQFLQFHIGGTGYFEGAKVAGKFNAISQVPGLFTGAELEDALFEIPTLLVAGHGEKECLNVGPAEQLHVLQEVQSKLPLLTPVEKVYLEPMVLTLANHPYLGSCFMHDIDPQVKALASSLLPSIK